MGYYNEIERQQNIALICIGVLLVGIIAFRLINKPTQKEVYDEAVRNNYPGTFEQWQKESPTYKIQFIN